MLNWLNWDKWEEYQSGYASNYTDEYIDKLDCNEETKKTIRQDRDNYRTSTNDGSTAVSRGTATVGNDHRNVW
jgi:hypothetical protein